MLLDPVHNLNILANSSDGTTCGASPTACTIKFCVIYKVFLYKIFYCVLLSICALGSINILYLCYYILFSKILQHPKYDTTKKGESAYLSPNFASIYYRFSFILSGYGSPFLLQIFLVKLFYFIKRYYLSLTAVVQVGMGGTFYYQQFFVITRQFFEGILTHIA